MKNILDNYFVELMIVLWIIYTIPILIASYRKCKHINGIALINILIGTTILGWIGALIWAVSDSKDSVKLQKHKTWGYLSLLVFAIGLSSSLLIYNLTYNKPHDDIDTSTPAYSMSTGEIWKLYTEDLSAADSIYTGKVIELTGNFTRIDKNDSLVSVIFVMEADSMFGDKTISCMMYQKHNDEAIALTAGTNVKIKGYCTGFNDPDIKFNKCSIVK